MSSYRFFAPSVMPPSCAFELLSSAVSETLRSVAATRSWFLPCVRSKTFASIGIVLLRSAMPCARRSPRRNSVFAILNSMVSPRSLLGPLLSVFLF